MLEVPTPRSVKSESLGWVGPRPPCFLEGPRRPQTVVGSRTEKLARPPLPAQSLSPPPAGPFVVLLRFPAFQLLRASSVPTKGEEVPSSQPTTARSAPTWRFSLLTPWGELRGGNRHTGLSFVTCH